VDCSKDAKASLQPIESDSDELADSLLANTAGCWKTQAIGTFAELEIADHLENGPMSSDRLAAQIGCPVGSLDRFLMAALTLELVTRDDEQRFHLTDLGACLASNSPNSVRNWTLWWSKELWQVWGELTHSVKTGQSARSKLYGTTGFAHLENDPARAKLFHSGLAEITRLAARNIVQSFDFSRFPVVMDVGGGYGQLLAEILRRNPETAGILFDLPTAIEQVPLNPMLEGRFKTVAGDFFQSIPPDADAVILKSVIHDWPRDEALKILSACRRNMKDGSSLLLIERMVPSHAEATASGQINAQRDLAMLVAHGAQERSEDEYRELLGSSGFDIASVTPTSSGFSIMEAV
jgi:hypothetical protein